jgi:putative addiction module CopG family antidote
MTRLRSLYWCGTKGHAPPGRDESETTMHIHLPTHLRSFIEREVASGRYESESQVIEDALERLADAPDTTMTVAEAVAESLAQMERGDVVAWDEDFLAKSAQRAMENSRKGHKVRDEVRY